MIHAKQLRLGLLAAALFTLQLQAQELGQVQALMQPAQGATAQPALSRGELNALLNAGASDVLALAALSPGEMRGTSGGIAPLRGFVIKGCDLTFSGVFNINVCAYFQPR